MKNVWLKSGSVLNIGEIPGEIHPNLPVAVYKTEQNPKTGDIYLIEVEKSFKFDYKVYAIEKELIDRFIKTYANTRGNIGILLNGLKGTGKTVTAKLLCNALNLPVIIVTEGYKNIGDFINTVQNDVIFFFDEYEKLFSMRTEEGDFVVVDDILLSVMDGALNTASRKVFLLTTNKVHINENLLQRPGRIRYFKTFEDLDLDTIMEIVNDTLVHKDLFDEVVSFISELDMITVDIVKSIVEEVNIHKEPPTAFEDVFNVEKAQEVFNVYTKEKDTDKWILEYEGAKINSSCTERFDIKDHLFINNSHFGNITEVIKDNEAVIKTLPRGNVKERSLFIKIEKCKPRHASFSEYAF